MQTTDAYLLSGHHSWLTTYSTPILQYSVEFGKAQIGVPGYASPVQLEALDLELGPRVLFIKSWTWHRGIIEEPVNGVDLDPNVDGVRFEPLRLR